MPFQKERCGQAALRQWPGALAHPTGRFSGLPRFSLCEIRYELSAPPVFFPALFFSDHLLCCLRMEKYFRYALPSMLCIRPSIQAKQSASSNTSGRFSGFGPAGFAKQQVALDWQCAASYARNSSRFANSKISLLMPLPLRRSIARHPRAQKGRRRLACRKAGRCGPGLPSGREST